MTLSETSLLATAVACLGSQASSPICSTSCWPRTPPAALMSLTAISAPRFICSPKAAYWPVIGPTVAILICAKAGVAAAMAATASMPKSLFMKVSHDLPPRPWRSDRSLMPLLPAQQAFALVEPWILPDHLARARQPIGKGGDAELDDPPQEKPADRPQFAAGQGVVEE